MAGASFQHIGDGLDPPVWVHGKANQRPFDRIVKGKVVKEQEWVEEIFSARPERSAQQHTGAFYHHLRLNILFNRSGYFGHRNHLRFTPHDCIRKWSP